MFSLTLLIIILLLVLFAANAALKRIQNKQERIHSSLRERVKESKERFVAVVDQISLKDEKIHQILTLYEINRKLAYILDVDKLVNTFVDELSSVENIESVCCNNEESKDGYASFVIDEERDTRYLHVACDDPQLTHQIPYLVSQLRILIDRAMIYKKMQKMSITDYLTNIANRRHFMERFRQEFNRTKKFNFPLSFLIIDIDFFKKINDTYGHLVGDEILRQVAAILSDKIREIDFIGRYGGEEFVVFLPEASPKAALMAAERLRSCVESFVFKAYDEKLNVTISIGASTFPVNAQDKEELLELADKALYVAKEQGRNRVVAA